MALRHYRWLLWLFTIPLLYISVPLAGQEAQPARGGPYKYVGPGGCSATACHGSIVARKQVEILQNEYSIWAAQDKHAKAFDVLKKPVAVRMAKILGLPAADTAEKCLVCHALYAPAAQRSRQFDISEGVSCESCHGPASEWLGPHINGRREQSLQLGMVDTKDLARRTEKCLTCHLGTAERFVDHEMIAAGHPDLVFELDSFQAVMPRHWKAPADPLDGVRSWSIGQAVQLRENLNRLNRRAHGKPWPEYAELNCFACHHSLTAAEDSWRQANGYTNRRPGNIPWNAARFEVFRYLAEEVDPQNGRQLASEMKEVFRIASQVSPDRDEAANAADRAGQTAERVLQQVKASKLDRAQTGRLLKAISGDAENIAYQDERVAEQAAMALDSLYMAYSKASPAGNEAEVRGAINGLFELLQRPSAYDPRRFAAQMKKVNAAIR
jgi:hypothetical protein